MYHITDVFRYGDESNFFPIDDVPMYMWVRVQYLRNFSQMINYYYTNRYVLHDYAVKKSTNMLISNNAFSLHINEDERYQRLWLSLNYWFGG